MNTRRFLFGSMFAMGVITSYLMSPASKSMKKQLFAKICAHVNMPEEFIRIRKQHLTKHVNGDVLELGPGPGFVLSELATLPITVSSYIGVEPNAHMKVFNQHDEFKHVKFPVRVLNAYGEAMHGIADQSVDTVVSTHVLCSVNDVDGVIAEVYRVLRPGGKFVFIEHTAASSPSSWTCRAQHFIAPAWKVIGDGCQFRNLTENFDRARTQYSSVHYESFDAPMDLFLVVPHVKGILIK